MNEYGDIKEIRSAWTTGEFEFPQDMNVAGIHYTLYRGSGWDFADAIRNGKNPYIIYHTAQGNREAAREAGLHQWIIFLWGTSDGVSLVPYDLRSTTAARAKAMYEQVETIGDVALLKLSLPSGVVALKGKVDTGAEISSLHCDGKPKAAGGTVQFQNRHASPNMITAPMVDQQAVSSADGGTEYRPVIELDVEVNGKVIRKAMFNLNDRSEMEYPVLIGQNVLEKTGFLVNPNQDGIKEDEEIEDDWLSEEQLAELTEADIVFENVEQMIEISEQQLDEERLIALYKAMDDANITFKDLFKHVRTNALQRVEEMEY